MPIYNRQIESLALSDFLASEAPGYGSRENIMLVAGQVLGAATVLGRISIAAGPTSAPKSGGNTGNGTLTLDATAPIGPGAKTGTYTVRFTVAATNNGTFAVRDPDGFVIGEVVMAGGAGAFSDDVKFAVADGSTDFVVGDGFDITVSTGSSKWTQLAPSATDGSQNAAGVLIAATDASAGDRATTAITRNTVLATDRLVWPIGISAGQKTLALNQLAGLDITARRSC